MMTTATTSDLNTRVFGQLPETGYGAPGGLYADEAVVAKAKAVIGEYLPELLASGALGRDILNRVCQHMQQPQLANDLWSKAKDIEAGKKFITDAKAIRKQASQDRAALFVCDKAIADAAAAKQKADVEQKASANKLRTLEESEQLLATVKKNVMLKGLL